ncbi:carbohydrate diacid regulator [Pelosinus fermentans]|uniref:CdaR family transcriptional regulator n=1 Tax=Pelosinus fermentans TaxID=365349 RepID=UPI0002684F5A|nr:sugar diacid recognition domain-containing protein [Pelosinus fermentans]OAM92999.1 transcriptional regulator, CdaR [Pelosinus fermentans DSM 17108]SDQ63627.1 carbohydrate diacid regulator [Pelosinus fermentans]
MLLTNNLAQPIVDHIMPIAQQNINIMDSRGVIIASGHKHRINTFHQGAKDVINSLQIVEIFPGNLDRYTGSLPGLNMPIVLHDQIIGVVGISGHPDKVRDIARMVKMVTELILEQEVLQEEVRSQFQLRETFAALLLSDHASTNYDKLLKTAKLLKYELSLPRLVLVVDIGPLLDHAHKNFGLNDLVSSRTRESIMKLLSNPSHIAHQDLVVFIEDKLIILKHFEYKTWELSYKTWASDLLRQLNTMNLSLCLGLGSLAMEYTALGQSYQEALFALHMATKQAPLAAIHDFDILSSYLIKEMNAKEPCQPLQIIKAKLTTSLTRKYDMKNTIVSLLNNNMNITSTAKSLYIHRNTLLFRLKKFKEITGLDPCGFLNHAILCKILFEE